MQRKTEDNQIIIACDFTGEAWNMIEPMIEGHRGSVISLNALGQAIADASAADAPFDCTMCQQSFEAGEKQWRHANPPVDANADAVICWDCIRQADRTFGKDKDIDWQRQIASDSRWK